MISLNATVISLGVLTLFLLPSFAQEAQNPQPVAPHIQVEDSNAYDSVVGLSQEENPNKPTGLRILFFSNPKTPRISVAVEVAGQQPVILASAVPPWRGTDYHLFPPGKMRITLLPGSILPAGPEGSPNLSSRLVEPLDLTLDPGTKTSVFVTVESGKLTCFPLLDTISTSKNREIGPFVKTINAGISGAFSIYARSGSTSPAVIWDSSMPQISESALPNGSGQYSFLLVEKTGQTEQPRVVYESLMNPSDVVTLIVHEDKYGRTTMTGIPNRVAETVASAAP